MTQRGSGERDIYGVNAVVRSSGLADLLDEPAAGPTRHLEEGAHTLCGGSGYTATSVYYVTCENCAALFKARQAAFDRAHLKRLAKGPLSIRGLDRNARTRLVEAGLCKVVGSGVVITDAGRARLKEVG